MCCAIPLYRTHVNLYAYQNTQHGTNFIKYIQSRLAMPEREEKKKFDCHITERLFLYTAAGFTARKN